MKKILLLLTLYFFLTASSLHDFFVSITQIDHSEEAQSLQLTFKFFTDDLEKVLEEQGTGKLYLGTEKEAEETNTYIQRYLLQKIELEVNDTLVDLTYLGKEQEEDVTWCYMEVEKIKKVESLKVRNQLFLETFEEQTNIVHTHIHQQKKSLLLSKGHVSEKLLYE